MHSGFKANKILRTNSLAVLLLVVQIKNTFRIGRGA